MAGEEAELRAQLRCAQEDSPEYATLLVELGELVLAQGNTADAQQLFDKARAAQAGRLEAESQNAAQGEPPPVGSSAAAAADGAAAADDWEVAWDAVAVQPTLPPPPPAPSQQQQQQQSSSSRSRAAGTAVGRTAPQLAEHTDGRGRGTAARGTDTAAAVASGSGRGGPDFHSPLRSATVASGGASHVVEVYGLTTAVKQIHLEEFVEAVCPQDGRPLPFVRWVDDQHALIVCNNVATATLFVEEEQDLFKLRPFSEACEVSRNMPGTELLPPRDRPKTTTAVARKLLSHHLGMAQLRDKGAERDLAQQRKAAKEAKREREAQLASAWDD